MTFLIAAPVPELGFLSLYFLLLLKQKEIKRQAKEKVKACTKISIKNVNLHKNLINLILILRIESNEKNHLFALAGNLCCKCHGTRG